MSVMRDKIVVYGAVPRAQKSILTDGICAGAESLVRARMGFLHEGAGCTTRA
jgi:hypothetical protein